MSINAYRKTIADTQPPRDIERRLLSGVTSQLVEYGRFDSLVESEEKLNALSNGLGDVIWHNQKIWLALKFDLVEEKNALPPPLRAGLLSLALWVERHSVGVMRGTHKIKPLIDVNLSIIKGLSGDATPQVEEAVAWD